MEAERDLGIGVLGGEPLDDRADTVAPAADAAARLGDERARHQSSRSRGPAQTTSSAGQPAQVNSLGVGRKSPAWIAAIASDRSASSAGRSARVNVVETTSSGRSRNA